MSLLFNPPPAAARPIYRLINGDSQRVNTDSPSVEGGLTVNVEPGHYIVNGMFPFKCVNSNVNVKIQMVSAGAVWQASEQYSFNSISRINNIDAFMDSQAGGSQLRLFAITGSSTLHTMVNMLARVNVTTGGEIEFHWSQGVSGGAVLELKDGAFWSWQKVE